MLELAESSIMCKTNEEFLITLNGLTSKHWEIIDIWSNGHRYQITLTNTKTNDRKNIFLYKKQVKPKDPLEESWSNE